MEENDYSTKEKRYIILVIYDITDNRTRNRMVKCLEGYGIRVQKSAFEMYLSKKQYSAMWKEAVKIINQREDSLRSYLLTRNTLVRTCGVGDFHQEEVIIV